MRWTGWRSLTGEKLQKSPLLPVLHALLYCKTNRYPTDYFCNLHLDLPVCKENGLEIYDLEEKNPDHPRVKAYWDHWDQLSNWQESHAVLPGNVCDSFRLVNAV